MLCPWTQPPPTHTQPGPPSPGPTQVEPLPLPSGVMPWAGCSCRLPGRDQLWDTSQLRGWPQLLCVFSFWLFQADTSQYGEGACGGCVEGFTKKNPTTRGQCGSPRTHMRGHSLTHPPIHFECWALTRCGAVHAVGSHTNPTGVTVTRWVCCIRECRPLCTAVMRVPGSER